MIKCFDAAQFPLMEKTYRTNLFNSFLGLKPAVLIGTVDDSGKTNLAIFSQVIHVGANPPLMGILFRPDSVARHTLQNLSHSGVATINLIPKHLYHQAHWTSARFEESEFEKCGFEAEYHPQFKAPFVGQSPQKCGVKLVELTRIKANETIFAVVGVELLLVEERLIMPDGMLDIEQANLLSVVGLDTYLTMHGLKRLAYAKPDRLPEEYSDKKHV